MDFASIIVFLILYYIRPQEWISSVESLKPVTLSMAFAIIALFTRQRGVKAGDFFKTPHDWVVLIYWLWIVIAAPSPFQTFKDTYTLPIFYYVTVQCLSSTERIQRFLNWWTGLIFVVALLAVGSHFGIDPTGSAAWNERWYADRVTLIMSIFNNPNSLGHSVVPVVLMIYFVCVWKRPVFIKIAAIALFSAPLYCMYLTKSKGTYLTGFTVAIAALTFGRPKAVQMLIVVAALTLGWAGMQMLPRMEGLGSAQSDEGMQGRVAAFKFGLESMRTLNKGLGYQNFAQAFTAKHHYMKASHSSYVKIGSELGYTGLFLYLSILYTCVRTVLGSKTSSLEEERVRRLLFTILASYMISCWMIDIAYRAAFFLMAAAIAAYHRQMLARTAPQQAELPASEPAPPLSVRNLPGIPTLSPAGPQASFTTAMSPGESRIDDTSASAALFPGIKWNRITWLDVIGMIAMTYLVIRVWRAAIDKF